MFFTHPHPAKQRYRMLCTRRHHYPRPAHHIDVQIVAGSIPVLDAHVRLGQFLQMTQRTAIRTAQRSLCGLEQDLQILLRIANGRIVLVGRHRWTGRRELSGGRHVWRRWIGIAWKSVGLELTLFGRVLRWAGGSGRVLVGVGRRLPGMRRVNLVRWFGHVRVNGKVRARFAMVHHTQHTQNHAQCLHEFGFYKQLHALKWKHTQHTRKLYTYTCIVLVHAHASNAHTLRENVIYGPRCT